MSHIRVDLPNTNNKWVRFGLANVDTFIIRIGFALANVDTIRICTRYEHDLCTRIATPNGSRGVGSILSYQHTRVNFQFHYTLIILIFIVKLSLLLVVFLARIST